MSANGKNGDVRRFERHWQTQRLVDAFAELSVGESISKQDLADKCEISVEQMASRIQSAKRAALHEHHVIIRSIRGFGFERLGQEDADVPAAGYLAAARRKAHRARDVHRHGITDWDGIDPEKRKLLFAQEAQCGVIAMATTTSAQKKLVGAVSNTKLDFGRTLELLKK